MWRERLRPASFKGATFFVEDHEAEIARRLVVNEYPFRDEPYTEDLGKSANRYNITGYVIGADYMDARDALMDAVEEGGSGTLVHPFLGSKIVNCESIRVRESKNEGGHAIFTLIFVQSGKKLFPDSAPVPNDLVSLQADSLIDAARTEFIDQMQVVGVPEWVRETYAGDLSATADIFNQIRMNGGINKQTTTALINQAAEWVADVAELSDPSLTLVADVAGTADRMIDTFKGVLDLASSAEQAIQNLDRFSDFTSSPSNGTSAQAVIADANASASETFFRTVALANETKALVDIVFPSFEEATVARETSLARIDALAGDTTSDDLYESFRQLRTEVANAVPGEDSSLPRIRAVDLNKSLPSLALSYELYGTVDREQELIDRNNVRDPGLMPGGQNIEVLEYVEDTA